MIPPVDELLSLVRAYNHKTNERLIAEAYDFAKAAHEGQKRNSGESYFTHHFAVAQILAGQRLDDSTLITALLHDTIEDTGASYEIVTDKFGREVADLSLIHI